MMYLPQTVVFFYKKKESAIYYTPWTAIEHRVTNCRCKKNIFWSLHSTDHYCQAIRWANIHCTLPGRSKHSASDIRVPGSGGNRGTSPKPNCCAGWEKGVLLDIERNSGGWNSNDNLIMYPRGRKTDLVEWFMYLCTQVHAYALEQQIQAENHRILASPYDM